MTSLSIEHFLYGPMSLSVFRDLVDPNTELTEVTLKSYKAATARLLRNMFGADLP